MNKLVNDGVASLDESGVFRLSVTHGCDEDELAGRIDEQVPHAWLDPMERVGRELLDEHEQGRKRKIFTPSADAEPLKYLIVRRLLREVRKS